MKRHSSSVTYVCYFEIKNICWKKKWKKKSEKKKGFTDLPALGKTCRFGSKFCRSWSSSSTYIGRWQNISFLTKTCRSRWSTIYRSLSAERKCLDTIWNRTRPKMPLESHQTRELIYTRQTSHKQNNKDLSRLTYFSPGMRVNTRYINLTKRTF